MFPSLLPAIALLSPQATPQVSMWVPAPDPSTVPAGEAGGSWGAAANIPAPFSVDVPSGASRAVTIGGEQIQVDLRVFCRSGVFPRDIEPAGGRAPRVIYQGIRYRVLAVVDYGAVSAHQEVLCGRDLGGETP